MLPPVSDAKGAVASSNDLAPGQRKRELPGPVRFREVAIMVDMAEKRKLHLERKKQERRSQVARPIGLVKSISEPMLPRIPEVVRDSEWQAQSPIESSGRQASEVVEQPSRVKERRTYEAEAGLDACTSTFEDYDVVHDLSFTLPHIREKCDEEYRLSRQPKKGGAAVTVSEGFFQEDALLEEEREASKAKGRWKLARASVHETSVKDQCVKVIASASLDDSFGAAIAGGLGDTMKLWRKWCRKTDNISEASLRNPPTWRDPEHMGKEIKDLENAMERDRSRLRSMIQQGVHKTKGGLKVTATHLPQELTDESVSRYRKETLEHLDVQGKRIRQALADTTKYRKDLESCVNSLRTTMKSTSELEKKDITMLKDLFTVKKQALKQEANAAASFSEPRKASKRRASAAPVPKRIRRQSLLREQIMANSTGGS